MNENCDFPFANRVLMKGEDLLLILSFHEAFRLGGAKKHSTSKWLPSCVNYMPSVFLDPIRNLLPGVRSSFPWPHHT